MSNKIKIYSSKAGVTKTLTTDATTWDELKEELINKDWYNPMSMKAIDRADKKSLDSGDIAITDGMTIFLLPTKNDSGIEVTEEMLDEFVEELHDKIDQMVEEFKNGVADSEDLSVEADQIARTFRRN